MHEIYQLWDKIKTYAAGDVDLGGKRKGMKSRVNPFMT